jgi:hypothetical protein
MKIAVITTSFKTTVPSPPIILNNNIEYHAFVDKEIYQTSSVSGWYKHKALEFTSYNEFKERRNVKIYKILPFLFLPGFDYYVYIDATHRLEKEPEEIISKYLKNSDIACFKHSHQTCAYKEAQIVKEINFDREDLIDSQIDFYKKENYPLENGLFELPARIQKNTEQIQRMSLMWWELICKYSSRDQISFPFACFKNNIIPSILPGRANTFYGNDIMPQIKSAEHRRTV